MLTSSESGVVRPIVHRRGGFLRLDALALSSIVHLPTICRYQEIYRHGVLDRYFGFAVCFGSEVDAVFGQAIFVADGQDLFVDFVNAIDRNSIRSLIGKLIRGMLYLFLLYINRPNFDCSEGYCHQGCDDQRSLYDYDAVFIGGRTGT